MSLKPSVLILSGMTGFAALTGMWLGCQSQQAPLPTPSITASEPVKTAPNSTEPPQTPSGSATPGSSTAPNSTKSSQTPSATLTAPKPTASQPEPSQPLTSPMSERVRDVEKCSVNMAKIKDPNPPLNVRSTPNTDSDANIVGKLDNGAFVSIDEEKEGWFRISTPTPGWIAKSRTDNTCNLKVERVQFGQGQLSTTIDDRFVGGGTHSYHFKLAKGQRLKVVTNRGPLPTILDPNQKELYGMNDTKKSWTGNLTLSGDYTLQFESNYKGYEYSFTIAAE